MEFKVFVNAVRESAAKSDGSKARPEERMFPYTIEAQDSEEAKARGKSIFEFEHGMQGWRVQAVLTMQS